MKTVSDKLIFIFTFYHLFFVFQAVGQEMNMLEPSAPPAEDWFDYNKKVFIPKDEDYQQSNKCHYQPVEDFSLEHLEQSLKYVVVTGKCQAKLKDYWSHPRNKDFFQKQGIHPNNVSYESLNFCETFLNPDVVVVHHPYYLYQGDKFYFDASSDLQQLCHYYGFYQAFEEHETQEYWNLYGHSDSSEKAILKDEDQPVIQQFADKSYIKNLYCKIYPEESP
jgi:hypothetical protein